MDFSINTSQVDAMVALKAYTLYKSAQYSDAIPVLEAILDFEPKNWQARLFLAACWFKTNQPMTAQRALKFVHDNCPDAELKQKAALALEFIQASNGQPKQSAMSGQPLGKQLPSIENIIT